MVLQRCSVCVGAVTLLTLQSWSMYLHVSFKRALLREPFSTLFTLERPFSGMNSNMHLQLVSVAKRVLTNLTLKRFATLFGLSKIGGEFSFAVVAERLQDVRVIGMHQIVRLQVPLSYFPVVIILYAYYRIYKAASAQTRSIKNGSKVLINCSDIKGSDGRRRTTLTLRIHRGGAGQRRRGAAGSVQESSSRRVRDKNNFLRQSDRCDPDLIEHYVSDCEYEQTSQPCLVTSTVNGHDTGDVIETMRQPKQTRLQHPSRLNTMTSHSRMYQQVPTESPVPTSDNPSPRNASRGWQQKFAISRKLGKIAKEQKAAKTLGIVMGIFCICWVPFFITNVLYAICKTNCVARPDILFPIFTWLGYINSGMNPVIYACSMRDFRRAFYKILCRSCPKKLSLSAPRKNHNTTRKAASHTRNGKCVRFNDVTPQSDRYLAEMTSTYASEMTSATATSSDVTNGLSRLTSSANGCDSS